MRLDSQRNDAFLTPTPSVAHGRGSRINLAAIGSALSETPMKLLSTLTVAALMTAGAAFAAATPTATPATSATPAAKPAKHESSMHCEKQAKEKKLTGDQKDKFVKECKAGNKAN
jgi:hypothetical protein